MRENESFALCVRRLLNALRQKSIDDAHVARGFGCVQSWWRNPLFDRRQRRLTFSSQLVPEKNGLRTFRDRLLRDCREPATSRSCSSTDRTSTSSARIGQQAATVTQATTPSSRRLCTGSNTLRTARSVPLRRPDDPWSWNRSKTTRGRARIRPCNFSFCVRFGASAPRLRAACVSAGRDLRADSCLAGTYAGCKVQTRRFARRSVLRPLPPRCADLCANISRVAGAQYYAAGLGLRDHVLLIPDASKRSHCR